MIRLLIAGDTRDRDAIAAYLNDIGYLVDVIADIPDAHGLPEGASGQLVLVSSRTLPMAPRYVGSTPGDGRPGWLARVARASEATSALECGADDYLSSPYSLRELAVRIEAVLRCRLRPPGTDHPMRDRGLRYTLSVAPPVRDILLLPPAARDRQPRPPTRLFRPTPSLG